VVGGVPDPKILQIACGTVIKKREINFLPSVYEDGNASYSVLNLRAVARVTAPSYYAQYVVTEGKITNLAR
jgi:hypothetical protein